jgi:hypothetical protein
MGACVRSASLRAGAARENECNLRHLKNWYSNVILSEAKNLFVHFEKKY